jgi:hypothetical protein
MLFFVYHALREYFYWSYGIRMRNNHPVLCDCLMLISLAR